MNIGAAKWRYYLFTFGWLLAIALAFVYMSRPTPSPPPPPGWTIWRDPGATRAVALTDEGVFSGGFRGVFQLHEDGTATRVHLPATSGLVIVNAILLDRNGVLWAGHNQGVSVRVGADWETLNEKHGLPHPRVAALAVTKDGSIWLGTMEGAVRMPLAGPWNQDTMERLTVQDGLLHNIVSAVLEDGDGGLWFGNYAAPAGGVSRLKGEHWTHWTPRQGLPHPDVTSLMLAKDGRVWAGCGLYSEGGAAVFSGASGQWKLERTLPIEELAGPKVRSIHEDRKGRIWLGSEYDGLTIRHKNRTLRIVTPDDGLPAWEVMAVTEADDGTMWLGTLGGVVRMAPDAVDSLFTAESGKNTGETP